MRTEKAFNSLDALLLLGRYWNAFELCNRENAKQFSTIKNQINCSPTWFWLGQKMHSITANEKERTMQTQCAEIIHKSHAQFYANELQFADDVSKAKRIASTVHIILADKFLRFAHTTNRLFIQTHQNIIESHLAVCIVSFLIRLVHLVFFSPFCLSVILWNCESWRISKWNQCLELGVLCFSLQNNESSHILINLVDFMVKKKRNKKKATSIEICL